MRGRGGDVAAFSRHKTPLSAGAGQGRRAGRTGGWKPLYFTTSLVGWHLARTTARNVPSRSDQRTRQKCFEIDGRRARCFCHRARPGQQKKKPRQGKADKSTTPPNTTFKSGVARADGQRTRVGCFRLFQKIFQTANQPNQVSSIDVDGDGQRTLARLMQTRCR